MQFSPLASTVTVFYIVAMAINGGIVVYENVAPEAYCTLLNKMVSVFAMYNMAFLSLIVPVILLRHVRYPLGNPYCSVHLFISMAFLLQEFLIQNEFGILLLLCSKKPYLVGVMNEKLMKLFLVSLNIVLSICFSAVICAFVGGDHLVYRSCMGDYTGK